MLYKMSLLIFIVVIYAMTALTQDITSPEHYCHLKSPIDSTIFNFTNMQNDNDSIISLNDLHHLRVHFCRPLKEPCNGKQGYSICLHDEHKEIGIGKEPPTVSVDPSGKIIFKYVGDKCNATHDYTVDIEMKCNIVVDKLSHDLDVVYNRDHCSFQMAIESYFACPKKKEAECDLIDQTGYFNLRPLINRASNYVIKHNATISVIMNVCHSLLYGNHFRECNHETMVCLINETNPDEPTYTSLGTVKDQMNFYSYEGAVVMDLQSNTSCSTARQYNSTIRTIVEFICQPDAINTLPELVSGIGTCLYRFEWVTAASCNELELMRLSQYNQQPCQIRDPLDNQLFDVSKLRSNSSVEIVETHNAVYEFSVCGPLERSHCSKSGTGVCKYIKGQKIGVSKGHANTNLIWKRNQFYFNYTDGIGCGNHRRSYTTIYFNCAYFDSVVINDDDPCGTIITWSTPKVCSYRCATPDYKYNLINLREQNGNHHIQGETKAVQYHLNICEPLFDEHYTNCTHETGICKTILNDKGKKIGEINLGSQESGLKTEDGRFYLKYVNGSVCEEDKSKNITTEITFTCDADMNAIGLVFLGLGSRFFQSDPFLNFQKLTKGTPVFKGYNNCKYEFTWMTSFVCPDSNERLSQNCLVEKKYQILNFTNLSKHLLFRLNDDDFTGSFHVPVNGTLNKCGGTFMCDKESWEGKDLQPRPHHANELVAFQFEDDYQCKKDKFYNTLVKVWCNVWAGSAKSFLLQEDEECSTILELAKNKTLDRRNGNVKEKMVEEDDGSWTFIWLIVVGVIIIPLGIAGYYGYYTRGEMCLELLRMCYCMHIYRLVRGRPEPVDDTPADDMPADDMPGDDMPMQERF